MSQLQVIRWQMPTEEPSFITSKVKDGSSVTNTIYNSTPVSEQQRGGV